MSETPESQSTKGRTSWLTILIWGVVVLVVGGAILWTVGRQLFGDAMDRPVDKQAPDFTLHLFEGYEYEGQSEVTLSDLTGKVVVINFWAEWCVECKREADLLEATWRAYRDKGVVFLGVDWVDVEPEARKYLTRYNITYPNGPDLGSRIGGAYKLTGVPETFFIDKAGRVDFYKLGPLTESELTARLDSLLAQ